MVNSSFKDKISFIGTQDFSEKKCQVSIDDYLKDGGLGSGVAS